MTFNQNSYLVRFWARKSQEGMEVPNLLNLIDEVERYLNNIKVGQ